MPEPRSPSIEVSELHKIRQSILKLQTGEMFVRDFDGKMYISIEKKVKCLVEMASLLSSKKTTLERADFTLQLFMFVTAEKEREMFIITPFSSFCQLLSPPF